MINRLALTVALGLLFAGALVVPAAAAGTIESVEPAEISQGDTVLLTINGRGLPEGSLVVEFYPQQIAVLDILAASDTEIVAQCKVPSLAQPGMYNLLVYNQLGIEVFKEAALRVRSELFTPVFTAYSPQAFVEAEAGFAIMLTGDLISEDVLKLLNVTWTRGGTELAGLETSLAMAGPGTVVAAVSGNPGAGTLRGTMRMGGTPIYLLEVEIYRQGTDILGMSPAEVNGNAEWITVKVVGQGLTNLSSDSLALYLVRGKRKYAASSVSVLNDSAAESSFPGPLEPGEYELTAERDGQLLYSGKLTVTWEEAPEQLSEEAGEGAELGAEGDSGLSEQPFETTGEGQEQQSGQMEIPGGSGQLIQGISVMKIPAGADPVRMDLIGSNLTPAVFDRLTFSLEVDGVTADLVLATNLGGQYSLIFAPKLGEWQSGSTAELRISDPEGAYAEYADILPVLSADEELPSIAAAAGHQTWEVAAISVATAGDTSELTIRYAGSAAQLEATGFSGNFSLIPKATGLERGFGNLSTSGELTYGIEDDGTLVARAQGNFVSGSLLTRTKYHAGAQEVSIAELETAKPVAVIHSPDLLTISRNTASGELTPKILGWSVDFSPLEPADPSLVQLTLLRVDGTPASVASYIDGTRIHFSLTTTALLADGQLPSSIECRFSSDIGLAWNREPVDFLAVEEISSPYSSVQLEFAENEVRLTNDGFDLKLLPSGELPEDFQWSAVKLRSGNELLNQQIDGFMVREAPAELFGRPGVALEFTRNASMVSDEEYQELLDSLTGQRQVLITLSWEALELEQTGWITFQRPDGG